jgi:hypothetical protein
MARYNGMGWHNQSIRHSNARKYGKAGGTYLTMRDKINIKNFKIIARKNHLYNTSLMIPNKQRIRGVYDEATDMISLPHNTPDDLLSHEISHALDYKYTPPTQHDEQFYNLKDKIEAQIQPLNNH